MSSALRFSPAEDVEELEDLSREMPEMSLVRRSLDSPRLLANRSRTLTSVATESRQSEVVLDSRCLFPLLLLILVFGRAVLRLVS